MSLLFWALVKCSFLSFFAANVVVNMLLLDGMF